MKKLRVAKKKTFNLPMPLGHSHVRVASVQLELDKKQAQCNSMVISGNEGVGKTDCAKSLVCSTDEKAKYQLRGWFRANTRAQLLLDYRKWLQFNEKVSRDDLNTWDEKQVADEVNRRLNELESFLVVLDNADNPGQVRDLIPVVSSQGLKHLIITSRSKEWGSLESSIFTVDLPEKEEAVKMFEVPSGRARSVEAEELVEAVGRSPLALSQLGAYAHQNAHVSVSELLERFRRNAKAVMDRNDIESNSRTAWATLATMLESIGRKSEGKMAEQVLMSCSVLEPERIPSSLLTALIRGAESKNEESKSGMFQRFKNLFKKEKAAEPMPKVDIEETLKLLTSHNLLSYDVKLKSYSIHRLVQKAIQLHCGASKIERTLPALIESLYYDFCSDEGGSSSKEKRHLGYMAHLDCLLTLEVKPAQFAANGQVQEPRLAAIDRARLLELKAYVLEYLLDRSVKAKRLLEEALPIYESHYGPESTRVSVLLNNLALAHGNLGDHAKQKTLLERALRIKEAAYGPNDPQVAITVEHLQNVCMEVGDYPKATELLKRALRIKEAAYGPE